MGKNRDELKVAVEEVLNVVRGGLAMHGGNVELIDADPESGKVQVRFQGACVGCPMSEMTFKAGIEEILLEMLPEVKVVEQVA
jgi:Fe-S cluster biogenesis protein NfuA